MTTTHVCRISASEGQTATAKRFDGTGSSDTVRATAATVVEQTNDKGTYLCTFEDQDAGYAKIKLFSVASGRALSEGFCTFSGVDGEVLECGVGAAVLDSAAQSWTTEQVEFALEKLTLLGVVADAVVMPAGTFLCGRGDIEQIFGTVAVSRWGDLNNNEDDEEITARISYRISIADNYMRSTLGNGAWIMPLEGEDIPPILAYYTACLAGVLLYEGRGVQDYDARGFAQHQLSFHKKGVEDFVKGVLFGAISLTPLVSNVTSAAPEAS